MITHLSVRVRKLRKWLSRSYWAIRLLRLSKSEDTATAPGLVLIQIDGLSQKQFDRGIKEGHLPFLKYLMERQKYKTYAHYSGVPSTTPAVQGELFYGVKGCVPAFNFVDHETGETFIMFEPKSASQIESRISKDRIALLQDGSSYSNIFTGGAKEAHFCAASLGWNGLFKVLNPFMWPVIIIFHLDVIIRTLFLFMVELILAFVESIRGTLAGEKFSVEFTFILARVLVCVLLRELVVIGAKIDIARGLPIIHLNFFGYDEQSHRRGPSSKFAHWSLGGIDDSISRIWNEAQRADRRDYDIWIYSDHGQEDAIPYSIEHKKSIKEVISKIFGELEESVPLTKWTRKEILACCGGNYSKRLLPLSHAAVIDEKNPKVKVTGMGPIGHIYPAQELSSEEKERVILELLNTAKVPLVLVPDGEGKVEARTLDKIYRLPEDAAQILGDHHPFLNEATEDLIHLCHHPSAGKIIFSGWRTGEPPRTYPLENGSHAGFGPEETNGFALLPTDVPVSFKERPYLRPIMIREAVLRHLGRMSMATSYFEPSSSVKTLRIMTYNVHGCVGMDGKLSPNRIARVIARHDLDVVALQELDVGRGRSGGIDQAEIIARKLNMSFHFHPSFHLKEGQYGNAILSRFPMRVIRTGALPRLKAQRLFEPRGALWVELDTNGTKINLVTSHLSLWPAERLLQAEALLGSDWAGSAGCEGPVIICGDFNAQPRSIICQRMGCTLRDAQMILKSHRPHSTWIYGRIDHVFVSPDIEVMGVAVPRTDLDKVSSDHLPLIVELKINDLNMGEVRKKSDAQISEDITH